MELYLFLAMFLVYVVTAFFTNSNIHRKIWTSAFILAFVITAFAIGFLRVSNQDVMMSANNLNWYYLLYLFGSMSVILGLINLWMYRKGLWNIFTNKEEDKEKSDDDDDDNDI